MTVTSALGQTQDEISSYFCFEATASPCLLCTVTTVTDNVLLYKISAEVCLLTCLKSRCSCHCAVTDSVGLHSHRCLLYIITAAAGYCKSMFRCSRSISIIRFFPGCVLEASFPDFNWIVVEVFPLCCTCPCHSSERETENSMHMHIRNRVILKRLKRNVNVFMQQEAVKCAPATHLNRKISNLPGDKMYYVLLLTECIKYFC